MIVAKIMFLFSIIHTQASSFLSRFFSAGISLRNLNKSICIGSSMEGLDGPCRTEIAESAR